MIHKWRQLINHINNILIKLYKNEENKLIILIIIS